MNISPSRPDFVMFGYRQGDDYFVAASDTLTAVELENLALKVDPLLMRVIDGSTRIRLRTEMHNYITAWGRSYSEAFINLFGSWGPKVSPGRTLMNPQPSIEASRSE